MSQQHHAQDYMALSNGSKQQKYQHILQEFSHLIQPSTHPLSNLCNFIALLKQQFNWWWIGFYFVSQKQLQTLYLGPFQGPLACTSIKKGKGVCGTSWTKQQTIVVEDVNKFEGHIACSSKSQSEIVVPIKYEGKIVGVLDVDSQHLSQFDQIDAKYLQKMISDLGNMHVWKWLSQRNQ